MANRIRNLFRKILDHEVGVLGGEIQRLQESIEDLQAKLDGYGIRFERIQARVGMRVLRQERQERQEDHPQDMWERALQQERARNAGRGDDGWMSFEDFTGRN